MGYHPQLFLFVILWRSVWRFLLINVVDCLSFVPLALAASTVNTPYVLSEAVCTHRCLGLGCS